MALAAEPTARPKAVGIESRDLSQCLETATVRVAVIQLPQPPGDGDVHSGAESFLELREIRDLAVQ